MTLLRLAALAASVLAAAGLQVTDLKPPRLTQAARAHASRSVLILGSSVDRMAVEWFCGQYENFLRVACADRARDLAVGFVFHPGVGYRGDMQPPFYNRTKYGNIASSIIGEGREALLKHSLRMIGERQPDMVVVDTSLWDLVVWASIDKTGDPSEARLRQWCDHDMPNLLHRVWGAFSASRIVFRTAPTTARPIWLKPEGVPQFSDRGIEAMYDCVRRNSVKGKLFGKFDVIDYHGIVDELGYKHLPAPGGQRSARVKDQEMWLHDGYHPNKEPARRYMNEILRLMNLPAVQAADWAQADPVPAPIPKMVPVS